MDVKVYRIQKTLSANDTGETGGHQAGIVIPKKPEILNFFPFLDPQLYNPRQEIDFEDEYGDLWALRFIYYNNKLFGGTRNEYRLTGTTRFINRFSLRQGDNLILERSGGQHKILSSTDISDQIGIPERVSVKLGYSWVNTTN